MENYLTWLIFHLVLIIVSLLILFITAFAMNSFAAIHGNCKFFLILTSLGQFLIISCHLIKIIFWLIITNYDRYYMYSIPIFRIAQPLNDLGGFLTDVNNFLLVIERTIASSQLERYEQSRMNWPVLLSCEVFCICVSLGVAYLVHFVRIVTECSILVIAMALLTIIVLVVCHFHNTRKYATAVGVSKKYQMKEVEYLTRALIPACIVNALMRILTSFMAVFSANLGFTSYVSFMLTYHTIQTINAVQWGVLVVARHEGMRRRTRDLLRALLGRRKLSARANIGEINLRKDNTKDYFDYLNSHWG